MGITELKDDELDGVSGGFARAAVKSMPELHRQLEDLAGAQASQQGGGAAAKAAQAAVAAAPVPDVEVAAQKVAKAAALSAHQSAMEISAEKLAELQKTLGAKPGLGSLSNGLSGQLDALGQLAGALEELKKSGAGSKVGASGLGVAAEVSAQMHEIKPGKAGDAAAKQSEVALKSLEQMIDTALSKLLQANQRFDQMLDGIVEAVQDRNEVAGRPKFRA